MDWTSEKRGRLAVSTIVAIVGTVALINACGKMPQVIVWWLLFTIGCGVMLNSEEGTPAKELALTALLPTLTPLLVGLFMFAIDINSSPCISFPWGRSPFAVPLLFMFTWIAIFLFSYARQPLLEFSEWLATKRAGGNIDRIFWASRAILVGVAGLVLLIASLG
jgi:hypothetical protein